MGTGEQGESAGRRREGWAEEVRALLGSLPGRVSLTVEAVSTATSPVEVRLGHRPAEVYPAASLIKLPVLLTALEAVERGELSPDRKFTVGGEETGGAGVVEHFRPGTALTLADLLFCMIAVSDNAAANHVLDLLGCAAVNALCARLGLADTMLRRRLMDLAASQAGRENTTSPRDMHRLLRELRAPRLLSPAVAAQARSFLARQQHKLGWATFLPEERLAHKTGDLEGLFHDVGLLDPEGPVTVIYTFLSAEVGNFGEASVVAGRVGEVVAARMALAAGATGR